MTDNELLLAISDMMDKKLKPANDRLKRISSKLSAFFVCLCICIFIYTLCITANASYAMNGEGVLWEQLSPSIENELIKAKIPNASISVIYGMDTEFRSYCTGNSSMVADENTLYQIGSISKSYTALGILLLEDEEQLSLNDSVSKYLPWFTVMYKGKTVPPEDFTIAHLLYQISGFTNSDEQYPSAVAGMSVEESVRKINGCELEFYPSQQYAYANTNYRILGLIIETVSGKSYDEFMTDRILHPLGLNNTFTAPEKALKTGKVIKGSRLAFFRNLPYECPVAVGNVPAGYIYSSAGDMNRWLKIHMGEAEISEQFKRIVEKSHQPIPESVVDDNTHYAAGWFIDDETGTIYHSGGTPNYSANAIIRPASGSAVCVLTNMNASSNTIRIADNILDILEGKTPAPYKSDVWIIFDSVFSIVTIIAIVGIVLLILFTIKKRRCAQNRTVWFIITAVLSLFVILLLIIIPIAFNDSWSNLRMWAPPSLFVGTLLLAGLSIYSFVLAVFHAR